MRRSSVLAEGALLVAVALTIGAQAQSTTASSSLAGTVVNDDNAPVVCARVVVQGAAQVLSTRTGPDGRFSFKQVPFRARWIGVEGGSSNVIDDKRFPDPDNLTLVSHADVLLAGVLLDEHHQPIRNIEVTALARRPMYGRPRFVPVANDVTEADGSYCIQVLDQTGLRRQASDNRQQTSSGEREFLVGVIPTGTWLTHPVWAVSVAGLGGFPPTYFPSVTTSAAARVLSLRHGEARHDINFSLQKERVSRMEGTVLNPDVLTLSASDVLLEPPDEDVAIHRRATPDAKGHFVFDDVPPGEYVVHVFPPSRPEGTGRWGMKRVMIRGEPTVHVVIPTEQTQTFAGTSSFGGAPTMLPGVRLFFTVNAAREPNPSDRFPSSFYPSAFSSSDGQGRFAIKNLMPGRYRLGISGADWRGWHLDAITVPSLREDGSMETRDVTETPLIVEAGRDIFGANVLLSPEVPPITGVVQDDTGKPIGSRVVLFPADDRTWPLWTGSLRQLSECQTRPDGTFVTAVVPPGDYFVVAVRDAPSSVSSQLFVELRPVAARVTVGPYPAAVRVVLTQVVWNPRVPTVGSVLRSKH